MNEEPEVKITEFRDVVPKGLLEKPVPVVNVAPLLKVMEEASVPISLCAPPASVTLPAMTAVAPVAAVIVIATEPVRLSSHPVPTEKSVSVPPAMVTFVADEACRVTLVLFDTDIFPIVCVVNPVNVYVPASLKTRISLAAGVVLAGVQLVLKAKSLVALFQV
jgi:hypothetical protein